MSIKILNTKNVEIQKSKSSRVVQSSNRPSAEKNPKSHSELTNEFQFIIKQLNREEKRTNFLWWVQVQRMHHEDECTQNYQ